MKILITGAAGFIGKNLILQLTNKGYEDLLLCDTGTSREELEGFARDCEFVFHLAGVNRPQREEEFMEGNFGFTSELLALLKKHKNNAGIVCTSSVQALRDNPYGRSKLAGEELLLEYGKQSDAEVFIFRLSNVFGKWCRPNYNSVTATFCHNIARGLPVRIDDPQANINLVYVDDVVEALIRMLPGERDRAEFAAGGNDTAKVETAGEGQSKQSVAPAADGRYYVHTVHSVTVGKLAGLLEAFRQSRDSLQTPDMSDPFVKKLYATYLSYLPEDGFSYALTAHEDARGFFTEILKQESFGQISVNVAKPGVTKGNHWHQSKNEKFLVVSGEAVIRFRRVEPVGLPTPEADANAAAADEGCTPCAGATVDRPETAGAEAAGGGAEEQGSVRAAADDGKRGRIIEYRVSGERPQVVDIPPGYTHNIENIGRTDLVTLMWVNESFDSQKPDTFFEEV